MTAQTRRLCRLSTVALLTAALAAISVPVQAAVSITLSPTSTSFSEDVNTPGTGWQFNTTALWLPSGWNSAYAYTGCVRVVVSGTSGSPSWQAYYGTNPSTSVNVALAYAGASACGTPTVAGTPISGNSGSPTTLGQAGNVTAYYYVVVQPTVAVSANVTITVTFKAATVTQGFPITMSPGNAIAVTLTPSSTSFSEDVTNPGMGWTFDASATWFPSGWSSAYTYHPSCVAVKVTTSVQGWSLKTYFTTSPSTSLGVALAQAGTGATCNTPGSAGISISSNSASPTTVLSSQNGTQTVNYYVVAQPTVAVTQSVTVTTNFTAQ